MILCNFAKNRGAKSPHVTWCFTEDKLTLTRQWAQNMDDFIA